ALSQEQRRTRAAATRRDSGSKNSCSSNRGEERTHAEYEPRRMQGRQCQGAPPRNMRPPKDLRSPLRKDAFVQSKGVLVERTTQELLGISRTRTNIAHRVVHGVTPFHERRRI